MFTAKSTPRILVLGLTGTLLAFAPAVAQGIGIGVGAGIGGSSGVGVGAGASLGGGDGVNAGAGIGADGGNGITASVDATVGGPGGPNAGLGLSVGRPGTGAGTGTPTVSNNPGLQASFAGMSSAEMHKYKRRCVGILHSPDSYDDALVDLCRIIRRQ